ncbi:hypothetical protein Tco_1339950 [Tanacetum coccineum]
MLDTPYWARPIRHSRVIWQKVDTPYWKCEYAFSCEDLALIRRISFPGYGVLVRMGHGYAISSLMDTVYSMSE